MEDGGQVRFLSAEEVFSACRPANAVAALRAVLAAGIDPGLDPDRVAMNAENGQMLLMPSSLPSTDHGPAVLGAKIITVAGPSAVRVSERIQGLYLMFDGETLAPSTILDGPALTTLRTPAVSVAAILDRLLGDNRPLRVVVFGAGPQAVGHVQCLADTLGAGLGEPGRDVSAQPGEAVSAQPGRGVSALPGGGVSVPAGEEVSTRLGAGVSVGAGEGVLAQSDRGLSDRPGGGASVPAGEGVLARPGEGVSAQVGGGGSALPGEEVSAGPGRGVSALPRGGVSALPGGGVSGRLGGAGGARSMAEVRYLVRRPEAVVVPNLLGADTGVLNSRGSEAESALRRADVIVCATTASEPLFPSAWVRDDAVVIAVGSHSPAARELPAELLGRASVVVEDRPTALREAGDVVLAIAEGALSEADLIPMAEVVGGRELPADRPVVFKSVGMAWQDLVVARAVLDGISRRG